MLHKIDQAEITVIWMFGLLFSFLIMVYVVLIISAALWLAFRFI